METRANYVLIGAVTLATIISAFLFFLWYARIALDRQYEDYDILFDQVSGLSRAADVRFNGILVGQVISIDLARAGGTSVRVGIQVDADTPINSGTVATLRSQGVTGVSFVALTSGAADAPPLEIDAATGTRVIKSEPSVLDSLIEGAPQLLKEATDLLRELSAMAGPENRDRVSQILANVETASGGLEKALSDFSSISGTVREGVDQISAFTGRLQGIADQAEKTLATADTTFGSATGAFDSAKSALASASGALVAAQTTFHSADALITTRGPGLVDSYEALASSATRTVGDLGARGAGLMERLDSTTEIASARLRELESPIAAAGPAITAVQGAAGGMDRLLAGDGAALVAEARTALASVNAMLETDAPRILDDVRIAAATVNRVVSEVGADVGAFAGRLDGVATGADVALKDASDTFRNATATLQRLGPAVASAERAMASADAAFASAERVLNTDVEPIVTDLRSAVSQFNRAVEAVTADLPAITAEARGALEAATRAAQRFEAMMAASAPPVESFAQSGLPQFSRLAADARALVATLEQLTQRIERDPARFFLGGQPPEYRR